VPLSNAAWAQTTIEFTATGTVCFVTVQTAAAAPTDTLFDEVSCAEIGLTLDGDAKIDGELIVTGGISGGGLPVFANNAAAIAGGLTTGRFYRTGTDPDPVCVVH
jgi:hypothetical protein